MLTGASSRLERLPPKSMEALDAGQLIFRLNDMALSKTDPRLKRIKACLDQVNTFTALL